MAEASTMTGALTAHPAKLSMHIEARDIRYSCAGAHGPELSADEVTETVFKEACWVFGVDRALVESRLQNREVVSVRHAIVMVLRAQETSFPAIGRIIRRDHTTAMSGYKRGCSLFRATKAFRDKTNKFAGRLEAKAADFAGLRNRLEGRVAEFEARR